MIERSKYDITQYEETLQKWACNRVAEEAGITCKIRNRKFIAVDLENWEIKFSYYEEGGCRRITIRYHKPTGKASCCGKAFTTTEYKKHLEEVHEGLEWYGYEELDTWELTIEPKVYITSGHLTKLDIYKDIDKERVLQWLDDLMQGIKPTAKFCLAEHIAKK